MPSAKSNPKYGSALQRHLDKKHNKEGRMQSRPRTSPWRKLFYVLVALFLLTIVGVVMWMKSQGISMLMLLLMIPAMIAAYVTSR